MNNKQGSKPHCRSTIRLPYNIIHHMTAYYHMTPYYLNQLTNHHITPWQPYTIPPYDTIYHITTMHHTPLWNHISNDNHYVIWRSCTIMISILTYDTIYQMTTIYVYHTTIYHPITFDNHIAYDNYIVYHHDTIYHMTIINHITYHMTTIYHTTLHNYTITLHQLHLYTIIDFYTLNIQEMSEVVPSAFFTDEWVISLRSLCRGTEHTARPLHSTPMPLFQLLPHMP